VINIKKILFLALALHGPYSYAKNFAEINYSRTFRESSPQLNNFNNDWVTTKIIHNTKNKRINFSLDAGATLGINNKKVFLSVRELNIELDHKKTNFKLGRQVLDWNEGIEAWGLNHLNSQDGLSETKNSQEGLTGISIERKLGNFNVHLFGSLLYIPQLKPGYEFGNDGTIFTRSEWIKPPPSKVLFRNITIPVHYDIVIPEAKDILFHSTIGLQNSYEWSSGEVSAFGIYKPENRLRINGTGHLDQDSLKAMVKAKPFVNHHLLLGAKVKQSVGSLNLIASVDYDRPKDGGDSSFIFNIKEFKPVYIERVYSSFSMNIKKTNYALELSYIKLIDEKGANDEFFSTTSKWTNAISFKVDYSYNDFFLITSEFNHDFFWKDSILKSRFSYKINKDLFTSIGAELIASPEDDSYWSYFRTNDNLFTEISYLF
jgi:hypothetical protein